MTAPLTIRVSLIAFATCLCSASQTLAHSITVLRGIANIEAKSISIAWNVHGEDLLHAPGFRGHDERSFSVSEIRNAAEAYGQMLCQRIIIRSDKGEVIDGQLAGWTSDNLEKKQFSGDTLRSSDISYRCEYDQNHKNKYLSFQYDAHTTHGEIYSNIVLNVQSNHEHGKVIQLTKGGNVEVVHCQVPTGRQRLAFPTGIQNNRTNLAVAPFVLSDSQRTIRAVISVGDSDVTVDTYIPTRLMESWIPINRKDRDFLHSSEMTQNVAGIKTFIKDRIAMQINRSQTTPNSTSVELLDAGELQHNSSTTRRLSTLTSRIRIRTEYSESTSIDEFSITWSLFNSSVLTAQALIVGNDECVTHEISTYQPQLHWHTKRSAVTTINKTK